MGDKLKTKIIDSHFRLYFLVLCVPHAASDASEVPHDPVLLMSAAPIKIMAPQLI